MKCLKKKVIGDTKLVLASVEGKFIVIKKVTGIEKKGYPTEEEALLAYDTAVEYAEQLKFENELKKIEKGL